MTQFETLAVKRDLHHAPAKVFAAFASPEAIKQWAAPDPRHEMVFAEADFRVGGCDRWNCGPNPDQSVHVEARHYDIVPDARIVFTERLAIGSDLKSVALITNDLATQAVGTRLTVTAQITGLSDMDIGAGYQQGYEAALDGLTRYLSEPG